MEYNKSREQLLIIAVCLATGILSVGCASTPVTRAWKPWHRTIQSEQIIAIGSTVNVLVDGSTEPLFGSEELLVAQVADITKYLLERRGYQLGSEGSDYSLRLVFSTVSSSKTTGFNIEYPYQHSTVPVAAEVPDYGLGIAAARSIRLVPIATSAAIVPTEVFIHTISMELRNQEGKLILKSDSRWSADNIDIRSDIVPAIQMILGGLPKDMSIIPQVREIIPGREQPFFIMNCRGYWYSCPALPYRIGFPSEDSSYRYRIKDPEALSAYLDLIQTAEFALPKGRNNLSNPFSTLLWTRALLGGVYLIGSNQDPVNILISLTGGPSGYRVQKCWIASDSEFSDYENELVEYLTNLRLYYELFNPL